MRLEILWSDFPAQLCREVPEKLLCSIEMRRISLFWSLESCSLPRLTFLGMFHFSGNVSYKIMVQRSSWALRNVTVSRCEGQFGLLSCVSCVCKYTEVLKCSQYMQRIRLSIWFPSRARSYASCLLLGRNHRISDSTGVGDGLWPAEKLLVTDIGKRNTLCGGLLNENVLTFQFNQPTVKWSWSNVFFTCNVNFSLACQLFALVKESFGYGIETKL